MILSEAKPCASRSATSDSITNKPDEMPGSFPSRGVMKLFGYQVPPAAAGAT
jgi:hypothetical protein